jgi:hypothetical protein
MNGMKKNYILATLLIAAVGLLAVQQTGNRAVEKYLTKNGHTKYSAGAPIAKTGAPGESNCTGCHAGTAQDGSTVNSLIILDGATPITNYAPGMSYSATLTLNTMNIMEGFQVTVLDGSNNMAGSFVAQTGSTSTSTGTNGRAYATHTTTSNTAANPLWLWTWNAPATDMGPVTFYIASNIANGNSLPSGDVIYLSQHVLGSAAGLNDVTDESINFSAGYASNENKVIINFNSLNVGIMFMNLVALNGKSVYTYDMGESVIGANSEYITLPSHIKSGIYIVNFFIGNRALSTKIMIQK